MLSRPKRVPYANCIDEIDKLKDGDSFVVFTSYHEITIGFESHSYYVEDVNCRTPHFICQDKMQLIERIKKAFDIASDLASVDNTLRDVEVELKTTILSALIFHFEDITKLEPPAAIKALQAIRSDKIDEIDETLFNMQGILKSIVEVRRMLSYPHPEGRKIIISYIDEEILKQKAKIPLNSSLNDGHKFIIKSVLEYTLEDIAALEPQAAITALNAITCDLIDEDYALSCDFFGKDEELFKAQNILGGINEIRRILVHPCPQNKVENYPYFDFDELRYPNIIIYKNAQDKPAFERNGLLNLVSRIGEATYVTKQEVVDYIHALINQEIQKQQEKLSTLLTINNTQKNIIENIFKLTFENITKLDPPDAIQALESLTMGLNLFALNLKFFRQLGVSKDIKLLREILDHNCPQNRTDNDPAFDAPSSPNIVVYKDAKGKPAFEEKGLLNLTAYNGLTTSVTKEAVYDHMNKLIKEAIQQQKELLLTQKENVHSSNDNEKKSVILTDGPTTEDFMNFPPLPEEERIRYWPTISEFWASRNSVAASSENTHIEDVQTGESNAEVVNPDDPNLQTDLNFIDESLSSIDDLLRNFRDEFNPLRPTQATSSEPFSLLYASLRAGIQQQMAPLQMQPASFSLTPTQRRRLGFSFAMNRASNLGSDLEALQEAQLRVRRRLEVYDRESSVPIAEPQVSTWANLFTPFAPNAAMITALNRLNGALTIEHLKQWTEIHHMPIASFTEDHAEALIHFVQDENISPVDAIDRISRCNHDLLEDLLIASGGYLTFDNVD